MHQRERGYILIMTLLLVAIATLALAHVSRSGLARTMQAQAAQRELQRRWGLLSCQATFLLNAEERLTQIEKQAGEPAPNERLTVTLGDQTFDLVITDEQAKASVLSLYQRRGRQTTESNIRSLVRESTDGVSVRIKPLPRSGTPETPEKMALPELGSFAQVFSRATPEALLGTDQRAGAAAYLTCWGNGKLNFRRATEEALKQVCQDIITDNELDKLLESRRDATLEDAAGLLNQLALSKRKKDQLTELLTNESTCHGLWIVMRDDRRSWYRLAVAEKTEDSEKPDLIYTFAW